MEEEAGKQQRSGSAGEAAAQAALKAVAPTLDMGVLGLQVCATVPGCTEGCSGTAGNRNGIPRFFLKLEWFSLLFSFPSSSLLLHLNLPCLASSATL